MAENEQPSTWQKIKAKGMEKLKKLKEKTLESTKPVREMLQDAGEVAAMGGRAAKALYVDYPKYMFEELTNDSKKPEEQNAEQGKEVGQGPDAVQQADKGKRREARLQSEGVQGRQGEISPLRGRVNAKPPRRTGPKKSVPRPPQLRREER